MNANLKILAQVAAILLIALGLKYHYSTASVNELRWVLAPTTFLVEWVTGDYFVFESQAGYMSDDRTFLIAASCAGINFLIIAFLLLAFGRTWRDRALSTEWLSVPVLFGVAYFTTLIANTTRIVVALWLRELDLGSEWLDGEGLHRAEGIVIYFGFLLLLLIVNERVASGSQAIGVYVYAIASRSKSLLVIYFVV